MVRFLHTADWQLGKQFGQFEPDDAAVLSNARFEAIQRLAKVAAEQEVDFVLVAGDVFDAQGIADKTIHRLFNCLSDFEGPWILIPGNHDGGLVESVWTRAARLDAIPPNAHICLHAQPCILESLNVTVLPAPLTQRNTYTDLTEWFATTETPPSTFRIGLAHGTMQGILAEEIDSSNPIAFNRAEQARLDYLALGDWHGMKQISARTWYSGTPETDRFKANDSGRVLLVELSEPRASPFVTPLAIGQYRWRSESKVLQIPSDTDAVIQELTTLSQADVLQLTLSGQTDLSGRRRLLKAIRQAQGHVRGLVTDVSGLRFEPTPEDIRSLNADGYLGEVIAKLRADQSGPNAEVAKEALALLASILDKNRTKTLAENIL